jgi:hypothetical protein
MPPTTKKVDKLFRRGLEQHTHTTPHEGAKKQASSTIKTSTSTTTRHMRAINY